MGLKQYTYSGRSRDGKTHTGDTVAYDRDQALRALQRDGINVISLKESEKELPAGDPEVRLTGEQLALMYRQIATLYRAGIQLDRAFRILGRGPDATPQRTEWGRDELRFLKSGKASLASLPPDARVCEGISEAVTRGLTLAQAMSLYPKVFGPPHIAMVDIGAQGGIMPDVLEELAALTERSDSLRKKVRACTTYPIFVLVTSLFTVFCLFNFIMPQFLALVKEMNVSLPIYTWVLIYAAQIMRHPVTITVGVVLLVLWPSIWKRLRDRQSVRHLLDTGSAKAVFFGQVTLKVSLARGMQILAALSRAGISLRDSLPLAARACGNKVVGDALQSVSAEIVHGIQMSEAMKKHTDVFPRSLIAYVETGELSGELPDMLVRAAEIVSIDAHNALEILPELLEPVVIFVLGFVVGGIVLSVFMPLYAALKNL